MLESMNAGGTRTTALNMSQSSTQAFLMIYIRAYSLASNASNANGMRISCIAKRHDPCVSGSS